MRRPTHISKLFTEDSISQLRTLADQAFSRAAGAPLLSGNSVRILKDAAENYPAWLDAMKAATKTIHFESYIIHADDIGDQFADVLIAKAREGVKVRLIYDWMGALGAASWFFWRRMRHAGVEVRCFNPPRFDSPVGWISRDHRKMLSVDGKIGFVTGLCVGRMWVGDTARGLEPWRDTGVVIEGPAVSALEDAFAAMWAAVGPPISQEERAAIAGSNLAAGDVALRLVSSFPSTAGLYRLDQLIAAIARRSIWLTDAYFVGTASYVQGLRAAALSGVDVRLLVPRSSDIPLVGSLSRLGYRTLLEAGIRVFEWNGSMLHAKTAVADGRWSRVGSTNLNLASWMGNWELDVMVEDVRFGQEMEEMYLQDLTNATEIVLSAKYKVSRTRKPTHQPIRKRGGRGSGGKAATGVIRIGNTVGAAITNLRLLGPAEAPILGTAALLLLALAAVVIRWPKVAAIPLGIFGAWMAIALIIKALRLRANHKPEEK